MSFPVVEQFHGNLITIPCIQCTPLYGVAGETASSTTPYVPKIPKHGTTNSLQTGHMLHFVVHFIVLSPMISIEHYHIILHICLIKSWHDVCVHDKISFTYSFLV